MKQRALVLVVVATVIALSGCTAAPAPKVSAVAPTGIVKGTVTVTDPDNIRASSQGALPCSVLSTSGFSDFHEGAEVDAVNASGKVLAFASLQTGSTPGEDALFKSCEFPFAIEDVPRGQKLYGIQFGRRGIIHFKEEAAFGGHADISIGG